MELWSSCKIKRFLWELWGSCKIMKFLWELWGSCRTCEVPGSPGSSTNTSQSRAHCSFTFLFGNPLKDSLCVLEWSVIIDQVIYILYQHMSTSQIHTTWIKQQWTGQEQHKTNRNRSSTKPLCWLQSLLVTHTKTHTHMDAHAEGSREQSWQQ